ncbi:hypothetical protein ACFQZE_07055 [Paenibacillus sp. GCM10027627]|uniref:hypothetical protein n=1 Tax=unclassified Paenibacillus TaxID=185978 RepID=UPI00363F6474
MTIKDIFKRLLRLFREVDQELLVNINYTKKKILEELGEDEYIRITANSEILKQATVQFWEVTGKDIVVR